MASRRRTLLFLCALGLGAALVPAASAAAGPAQDPGATFGGTEAVTSTTAPVATSTTAAEAETNQTLVESEEAPDQPVFTENRKVAAVIGGLVLVALALLLLTVRYIRVTKPSSSDDVDPGIPTLPIDIDIHDDSVFVDDLGEPAAARTATTSAVPASGAAPSDDEIAAAPATLSVDAPTAADHDAADEDWEPRTGEHERVEIPSGATLARPGVAARRKALGVDAS